MARGLIESVDYNTYRQRVRRHRRTDVLLAVAALNTRLDQAQFGQGPPVRLPNVVQPFSLAGLARTALIDGNDDRDRPLTERDVVELCAHFVNIDESSDRDPGSVRLRAIMNQLAYEQFSHQYSMMENIGRTLAILESHYHASPDAPSPDAWIHALGVPLKYFMKVGFAMYVAAVSNEGRIDREVLKMDHVAPIFDPLVADDALEVVDRWFAATTGELRVAGRAGEVRSLEKWSLSPLVPKPIVALPDGRYVMPWPRLILDRITPAGLYFVGLDQFGPAFPNSLGAMFQEYVAPSCACWTTRILDQRSSTVEAASEPSTISSSHRRSSCWWR